jgi:peptidoglycan/xylan/chitin deacetylase (PgdA/CDA1 family)
MRAAARSAAACVESDMMKFLMWVPPVFALAASSFAQGPSAAQPDSIRVPILVYHSIAPHHPGQTSEQRQLDVDTAVFNQQMSYLAQHQYAVISLAALVDALQGRGTVPDRAVVITFDDGWETQYDCAFPILKRLGFTATFFVYPSPIEDHAPAFMTWDQLRELKSAGMTIGSHSRTHPLLTNPDASLREETEDSRDEIQRNLGVAPDLFAYPYGAWNARVASAVAAAGYRAARAFPNGPWNSAGDLFALRSILVTDDMDAFEKAVEPAKNP